MRFVSGQPALAVGTAIRRPSLVHGMSSDPALAWPLRRQVVTLMDVVPWTMPVQPGSVTSKYLNLQKRRLPRCGAVITLSQSSAEEAIDLLGLDPKRVHVVPLAAGPTFRAEDSPDDEQRRRRFGLPGHGYLLWVGSMRSHDPRKGLDDLITAVGHINSQRPPLVMAGAPGAESNRLAHLAHQRGVKLILTGFVSDEELAALYRGAAAAVLPSRHEGFGLTAIEAMACGTPLVSANASNLPALTDGGAHLVDAQNVEALATGIAQVLGDRELAASLRRAGPAIAARYSWHRTAELTIDVYHAVIEQLSS